MTPEAAETPLLDLLRDVPLDARLSYEHSPTYHQYIPVGTLISKAIGEIECLRAEVEALRRGEFICARCVLRKNSEWNEQTPSF